MFDFDETDRAIFEFGDGKKTRRVDPLVVRRLLIQASSGAFLWLVDQSEGPHDGEGNPLPAYRGDDPAKLQAEISRQDAQEKLILCVRKAFDLPPPDPETGEGVTELMCWRIFWSYWGFVSKNAKRGGNSPNSSSTTDSPPEPA